MATLLTDRPLSAPRGESGFFSALAPRGKAVLLGLAAVAVCALFAFPVFWLILTSLRPGTGVYYVHRGTEFTIDNFHEVLSQEIVVRALFNSFVISTVATVLSLGVTATSGYMLSRFKGPIPNTWISLRNSSASSTPIGDCCFPTSPSTSASSPGS
jgi:multiple sugar transport system permease protein